jgi:UDP-N-acetylglucosamine 3-dehydrogenase
MLRAGIIGCGGITERRHAPVLSAQQGVELVALADVSNERLQLLGDRHGVPAARQYTDYEKMLTDAALDIVHVCTPHDLHEAQAIAAMEACCHVLLEKPIATSAAEADRMAAVAARRGRKLTVSHNQKFCAAHEATMARIRAGDLGAVFLVRTEGFSPRHVSGRGANQDWRTQSVAGGGGPLIDNGYHSVYRAVDYMDSPIVRVFARISRNVQDIEVEDTAVVLFEHASGATTSLQVGWCAPAGSVGVQEIFGTSGQLRLGGDSPVNVWTKANAAWQPVAVREEAPDALGFPPLVAAFVDAVQNDGPVPVTAAESRHVLAAVAAAYESGRTGQPVDVT